MDKQSEPDLKCNIKCMKLLIEGWVPGSTGEDSRLPALSSSDFFSFGNTLMGTPLIGFFQAVWPSLNSIKLTHKITNSKMQIGSTFLDLF